jgi:serine-type D-Ala-D-Ala carboxypeptidase (penicillin-binding protein 5/6)
MIIQRTALSLFATAAVALSCPSFAATPVPPPPPVAAKGYVVVDAFSGRVLVGQNDTERLEPASLTKLMTAYVVFHALQDGKLRLDQEVPVSEHAWKAEGSRTFLNVGTRVRVDTLIQGMIVQSGNDATIALAEAVAGSESTFAALMNQYAQRIGLSGSHWMNAPGLPDPQHYTTARDIATLSAALIREFPQYYKWYSQRSFTYNNITQQNRNGLLERDPTVDGIKTGHTDAAGYCLAASALRDGMRLVSVVMGTASPKAREDASATLLGYGFNFYETKRLYTAGKALATVPVYKVSDPVTVVLRNDVYATAARGELAGVRSSLTLNPRLIAPLSATTPIGRLKIVLGDTVISDVPVYPSGAIEPGNVFRRAIDTVRLWFH